MDSFVLAAMCRLVCFMSYIISVARRQRQTDRQTRKRLTTHTQAYKEEEEEEEIV